MIDECYLDLNKQLDYYKDESDSRLNSYLAQIDATKVALDKCSELEEVLKLRNRDLCEREQANKTWAEKCRKLKKELDDCKERIAELEGELGWASKCVQNLEKENDDLLDVLCTLTFFAETTGGIAGKDVKLCEAIKLAEDKLFPKPQRKDGAEPCGECHLKEGEICCICGAVQKGEL